MITVVYHYAASRNAIGTINYRMQYYVVYIGLPAVSYLCTVCLKNVRSF